MHAGGWQQEAEGTALALALGHAVMAYLLRVPWLAKDILWVLPDARCGLIEATEVNVVERRSRSCIILLRRSHAWQYGLRAPAGSINGSPHGTV